VLTPSLYVTNPRTLNLFQRGVLDLFSPFLWKIKCSVVKQISESNASQIALTSEKWRDKWILHLHAHVLRDCVVHVLYQLSCVSISDWAGHICFAFAFLLFTYYIVHKVSMCRAEHSDHQNVPFVSLKMICKTTIWCNQILIVKQQWRAVILTSRMIFPFGILLVLQCL